MHKPYQWRPRGRARRYYGQRRGPHAIATPAFGSSPPWPTAHSRLQRLQQSHRWLPPPR